MEAEIVIVSGVSPVLVTVNVAVLVPCTIATLGGTVATVVSLLMSATTSPSSGAGPLSVSVACALVPANTLVGFRVVNEVNVSDSGGMQPRAI